MKTIKRFVLGDWWIGAGAVLAAYVLLIPVAAFVHRLTH